MPSPANRRQWRQFLIKPSFQLHLVLVHIFFLIVVALLMVFMLLMPFYSDLYQSSDLWARYASAEIWLRLLERGGLLLIIIAVISGLYHIFFSHRLCGPLVNMNHTFDALTQGDTTRFVILRRRDYLKEEALKINQMLKAIDHRIRHLKKTQLELANLVYQLPDGSEKKGLFSVVHAQQALLAEWTTQSPTSVPD